VLLLFLFFLGGFFLDLDDVLRWHFFEGSARLRAGRRLRNGSRNALPQDLVLLLHLEFQHREDAGQDGLVELEEREGVVHVDDAVFLDDQRAHFGQTAHDVFRPQVPKIEQGGPAVFGPLVHLDGLV
jgi:hypothetical protein